MNNELKGKESGKVEITAAVVAEVTDQKLEVSIPYKRDKRLIPVKELFKYEAEEQGFLWGNFIPTGSIVLLCGPSDGGKTMLARQICISIAKGDNELLSFNLNPKYKRAVYVSTEDSTQDWVVKMKKINIDEKEKDIVGENMLLVTDYEALVQLLETELKNNPVDLVVIDVLSDVCTGDLNSTSNIRAYLKPYKQLAEKYGVSFLFIHHLSKKGESSGSPNKQNVLGAMGIESSMRSVLELRKDPIDGNVKQITITKGNYVSEANKKKIYRIKHGENFLYESAGPDVHEIVEAKEDLITAIRKYKFTLKSVRKITIELKKQGFDIGKTKVSEILAKIKSEEEPHIEDKER